jgi:hypothetical protein
MKKTVRRLKIDGSMKQIEGTRCMRPSSNGGVRSRNADRAVA